MSARSFEHKKQMFKVMDTKMLTIFCSKSLFIWASGCSDVVSDCAGTIIGCQKLIDWLTEDIIC